MERATFKAVCEFFGSQKKTASALGVTPGAVNHVARGRKKLPLWWCLSIERLTGGAFSREALRPDIPWSAFDRQSVHEKRVGDDDVRR